MSVQNSLVHWFGDIGRDQLAEVGGKNASLGEMIQRLVPAGVRVPDGFSTTAHAYRTFLERNGLVPKIRDELDKLAQGSVQLEQAGRTIRTLVLEASLPEELTQAIGAHYRELCGRAQMENLDVAVRSSATAEDLPEASFAGQQETFLNIRGEDALLAACRRCYASLFTDRAIVYRQNQRIDHLQVALCVGVQRMVRSDRGASGVMFTLDTDSGFPRVILIDAAWGLGETVVQGMIEPDEYLVYKPLLDKKRLVPIIGRRCGSKHQKMIYGESATNKPTELVDTTDEERRRLVLTDEAILQLARWAVLVEKHYGRAMDIEWAQDGQTGALFVVQARPETVHSRRHQSALRTQRLTEHSEPLVSGLAIGEAIAAGAVCKLESPHELDRFPEGAILVTANTDPDWVPIMKRAAAIVTDRGGRTSHAAIVSRELGLPALVGTRNATERLRDGEEITVSCAEGETGYVYRGALKFETEDIDLDSLPTTRTQVMLNLANPAAALRWWRLPADGVGLARMEFIIANDIKIHPMALVHGDRVADHADRERIAELTRGWDDKCDYFVDALSLGIARLAAAHHPKPVIVRMSDFKTNEYARLIGGAAFEPKEENPMLGWRGARRYYSEGYREGFALECRAVRRAREQLGFGNVIVMIPFCRTPEEADRVLAVMGENGLKRGEHGLKVYVMCEIPSNVILAKQFAQRFDGFSIGSNDLTQLVLGVDRDAESLADLFDERNEAVQAMITSVIKQAHRKRRKVGLCGEAPSNHPEFARFLVEAGIDSMSVNPDSFVKVKRVVAEAERHLAAAARRTRKSIPTEETSSWHA